MSTVSTDFSPAADPVAGGALAELLESCSRCLDLSREYVRSTVDPASDTPDDDCRLDVDLDSLEHFLTARADLFAVVEDNLDTLTSTAPAADDPERKAVTGRVRAILEELTEIESQLSVFLGDRLAKMRDTISRMGKIQPVFRRYSSLGMHTHSANVTRHE